MKSMVLPASLALLFAAGCVARHSPPQAAAPERICEVKITKYEPPEAKKTALEDVLPPGTTAGASVSLAGIKIVAVAEPGAPAQTDYLTLDEALAASLCTVRETGTVTRDENGNERVTDGDVNTLLVSNTGQKPIFLMAGDLVLGGKQDRILATGLVVEPNTKDLAVSVFCVEHGRWTARAGEAQSAAGLFLNSPDVGQVDIGVKKAAVGAKDQSQVWQAVATNNANLGVTALSGGGSFRATYDSEEVKKKLDGLMKEAAPVRQGRPIGYAVVTDGDVAVMDLFDSTALCGKLSEKLLRSYLITALSGGYEPAKEHPLVARLRDKVTAKFDKMKLSEVVVALDEAWEAKLEFVGNVDPVINLSGSDLDMATVIDSLYVYFGAWANVKDENTIEIRSQIGRNTLGSGQSIPLLGDVPVLSSIIVPANPRAGIFFNDQDPRTPPVNFNQDMRGGFESIFRGNAVSGAQQEAARPLREAMIPDLDEPRQGAVAAYTPIQYECKDTKRERTVHRGYMRR